MDRKELRNFRTTQEWIKSRIEYIEERKAQVNKLNATLSDMPKRRKKHTRYNGRKNCSIIRLF